MSAHTPGPSKWTYHESENDLAALLTNQRDTALAENEALRAQVEALVEAAEPILESLDGLNSEILDAFRAAIRAAKGGE